MSKENQNLFPEKDLIDMRFMELLRYASLELKSKDDIDKALQELSLLKNKRAEVSRKSEIMCKNIIDKSDVIAQTIEDSMNGIRENIQKYYKDNWADFKFREEEGDKSKATITFEHGEIICIHKTTTELKIKPASTNGKAEPSKHSEWYPVQN